VLVLVQPVLKKGDEGGGLDGDVEDLIEEESDSEDEREEAILCAQCESEVTNRRHKTSIQGGFEHSCANPAGIVYQIGCFEEASGVGATGEESSDFTWFQGYTWQVVVCRECRTHLGWRYRSSNHVFFGLVLPRLTNWRG
jgi:hypothetical protein